MDVTLKEIEPMTVAFVRHVGPYAECGDAWKTLCANPEVCKLFGPNTQFLGLGYDDPDITEPDKIRYDALRDRSGRDGAVRGGKRATH